MQIPPKWASNWFLQEMVEELVAAHESDHALLIEHRSRRGLGFIALGDPSGATGLLARTDPETFAFAHMQSGIWEAIDPELQHRFRLPVSEDWNWMEISHVPPIAGSDRVREVNLESERDEVERVKNSSIPDSFLSLDAPGVRWFGWEDDDGTLRAIGGAMGWDNGAWPTGAHFGSIGTESGWEGRGIGSALTAGMIRIAIAEGATRASLGVYMGNDRAINVYRRLGFTTGMQIHSRHR